MAKRIFKYQLLPGNINGNICTLEVFKDRKILSAKVVNQIGCIWMLVNDESEGEKMDIYCITTGAPIISFYINNLVFIDTLLFGEGLFVLHLFYK